LHAELAAQAVAWSQQCVAAHDAQAVVPYGKPHELMPAPASAGALKYWSIPTA
jgi:hypothetical protein